jgi:hypothetical protein
MRRFLCKAGDFCPYCHGVFESPRQRKWCCYDALLWKRKQDRAKAAKRSGRETGRVGRPIGWKPKHLRKRETKPPLPYRVVYLVKSLHLYTIGKTTDKLRLQSRLRVYRTHNPHGVQLLHVIQTDDATRLEKTLHRKYSERCVGGEWFELTDDQVEEIRRL